MWSVQGKNLNLKENELKKLNANYASIEVLQTQLKEAEKKVAVVDSILFSGNFTIPKNITQSTFFDFVDRYSGDNASYTYTNTEYHEENLESGFKYYTYKVSGVGSFNNVYDLVYAIEHSKALKKIESGQINENTTVDSKGIPHYLVKFDFIVRVYFSSSDQYAEVNYKENSYHREIYLKLTIL